MVCDLRKVMVLPVFLAALVVGTPDKAYAKPGGNSPFIVKNDRGGTLRGRVAQIAALRQSGRAVQITGQFCYSTCTMFLGLPQTCVSHNTVFGFHGPSSYGRALDAEVFDRASELIAMHYPRPLRDWYLETGRHVTHRMYRIKGTDMIRMGIQAC